MHFDSRVKRARLTSMAVMFVPELALSAAIAWFLEGDWIVFLGAFFALQALGAYRWIAGSLAQWAAFRLYDRQLMTEAFIAGMRAKGFPEPGDYASSIRGYLNELIEDDDVPINVRLAAAVDAGSLEGWRVVNAYGTTSRFEIAYEDALERFKATFPPKPAELSS